MKKILIFLLAMIFCLGVSVRIFAQAPNVTPMWNNIRELTSSIVFNGTDGTANASVLGKSGTTSISGTLTVYRQSGSSWVYVGSTSGTSSTNKLTLEFDFNAVIGGYYKSVFEVTVTINGVEESETKTAYNTCS